MKQIGTIPLANELTDWDLDEASGKLYAISKSANTLTIVDTATQQVEKELTVGSMPSDLERYGNELYIASSGATSIRVVDMTTQTLASVIETTYSPLQLAVTSQYIFYTSGGSWNTVYKQDRSTGVTTRFAESYSDAVLKADESRRLLYIGETGSTGSNLLSYEYDTGRKRGESNYRGGYGFEFPAPYIGLDGDDVFYAGSRLDALDLTWIKGMYPRSGSYSYLISKLMDQKGELILTHQGLYSRDRYLQLAGFPGDVFAEAERGQIGDGRIYVQKGRWDAKEIEVYELPEKLMQPEFKLQAASGFHAVPNAPLSSIVSDETYLYGVSKDTNEVVKLLKSDLSVVEKAYVGSQPAHLELQAGKLYVAFHGETAIGILDASALGSGVQRVRTSSNPQRLLPAGSKLFYWGEEMNGELRLAGSGTNQPVFAYPNDPSQGQAVYDAASGSLYVATYSKISRYDAATLQELSSTSVAFSSGDGPVLQDGTSLYLGNVRRSKSSPAQILGTYPERPLAVGKEFVIGRKAVYGRDSYAKIADLPFEVKEAHVAADGTIVLATDSRTYRFANLDGLEEYVQTMLMPSDVQLEYGYSSPNSFQGKLYLTPGEDSEMVRGYVAELRDASGKSLSSNLSIYSEAKLEDGTVVLKASVYDAPAQAVSLAVWPRTDNYDWKPRKPVVLPFWNFPEAFAKEFSLAELPAKDGELEGTLTWKPGVERTAMTYKLYWMGEDDLLGEAIASVPGGKASYSLKVGPVRIPDKAVGLALVQSGADGEAPLYQYLVLSRFESSPPDARDISLYKYLYASDRVEVRNLAAGDMIRVYHSNYALLASGKPSSGSSSVSLDTGDMGSPGGTVFITRTSQGKLESEPVAMTIPAMIIDTPGGGVKPTAPPAGGGGGGGGGGMIGGGGGAPAPSPTPAPAKLDVKEETDANGVVTAVIGLNAAYAAGQLAGSSDVRAKSESKAGQIVFQIESGAVQSAAQKNGRLILETSVGTWTVPASALASNMPEASSLRLSIFVQDASLGAELRTSNKGAMLGSVVKFDLAAVQKDGSVQDLNDYGQYVGHTILVSGSTPASQIGGYRLNPETNRFEPVPVRVDSASGGANVTMYSLKDGLFAVVKKASSFKDATGNAAYDSSILTLTARGVLNGYSDGTFRPDGKVTRAEFAVMLSKALGLSPSASGEAAAAFKDVAAGSWYSDAVKLVAKAGIINGYSDGAFKPNQTITHQEMMVMLVKAMQFSGYKSISVDMIATPSLSAWAVESYRQAIGSKLIGTANDPFHFERNASSSRKESALLLQRLLGEILFQS
ncbi:S-layer homology domain-containing protein [Paenibacillus sp. B01]|uniref:S-layer homology domain-containing protein n=1 Tax=Paenibacillus sp. B01 TaxID=2660554 RepID=UPI0018911EA6|nr:S-layer homology domain-containing protein [Paenibacillus sp. B01]